MLRRISGSRTAWGSRSPASRGECAAVVQLTAEESAFRFLWAKNGDDQFPSWLSWYDDAQLSSTEGKVMLRAGQVERATSALASSIDHAVPRDQAVRAGRLATARPVGKDLDGALDAANRGLGLLETKVHSVRAVSRLTKFDGYLKPYGAEPAVAEFRERLCALPAMAG